MEKVLLGLSGGVDSAVAAFLLKKQGYEVIGAFMKNFSDSKNKLTGECSWIEERAMAQKIAVLLNIQFITLDFEKEYKKYVLDPMFKSYAEGLTPNPDALCNAVVKFPLLWKEAKKRNIPYIATGHYIKKIETKDGWKLKRAEDNEKDQSYFLYDLTQKDLEHTLFPIGDYTKGKVRTLAKRNKFPNYDKQGSRGICFVGKTEMKSFLKQRIKEKKGLVRTPEGKVIGKHPGIMYYTIGERIGPHLGFDIEDRARANEKWYIAQINKKSNTLVVAPENHKILFSKSFLIVKTNCINPKEQLDKTTHVRLRHRGELLQASVKRKGTQFHCTLKKPVKALAPGQSTICYKNNFILGGGETRLDK